MNERAERRIEITHESDIVSARQAGREVAETLGMSRSDVTLIATAISEVARNILKYAGQGELLVSPVAGAGCQGIRIVAVDNGPGIVDVELALSDGYTTGNGLGLGLPGSRRLMDDFDIQSAPGQGTTVTMTKWAL